MRRNWPVFIADSVLLRVCVNRSENRPWRAWFETWNNVVVNARGADRLSVDRLNRLGYVGWNRETRSPCGQNWSLARVYWRSSCPDGTVCCGPDVDRRVSSNGSKRLRVASNNSCSDWTCFYPVRALCDVGSLRLRQHSVRLVHCVCRLVSRTVNSRCSYRRCNKFTDCDILSSPSSPNCSSCRTCKLVGTQGDLFIRARFCEIRNLSV